MEPQKKIDSNKSKAIKTYLEQMVQAYRVDQLQLILCSMTNAPYLAWKSLTTKKEVNIF